MNFDEVIDRRSSESVKWRLFEEEVLPLWVADMDFRCPQAVMDALHKRVEHGIFGYGLVPQKLISLVVDRMKDIYSWKIEPDNVSFVPGVVTGFNLAMRTFCKPGDAVMVQTPVYGPFLSAPAVAGLKRIDNPLIELENGRYEVDYDLFEEQIIQNEVKMFILCNPHNPVGRVFLKEELKRMAEICLKHKVLICSDEIHCDLVFSGHKHIPIASLSPEVAAITLTLIAPSKTFNIAGLHASVLIVQNPELCESIKNFRKGLVGNPGLLSLVAAEAAYENGSKWLKEAMIYMESNRDWLSQAVKEKLPGIKMYTPEGTYLAWLDCRDLKSVVNPQEFFLNKARVALNDGLDFGEGGKGFVRLNFGTPKAILEEAIQRMVDAIKTEGI
ncbi:MAG: pyridoxal phosphate-dependent aminotransferase [Anaerolineaceae bacterium]|nr:pyridoxal phosphate-dependent aminotransferase [Anaerolineaceae bacterium]